MTIDSATVAAIIGGITTVLTMVLGALSYVYRDSLKRADAHMRAMEERYDDLLRNATATLAQVASSQASMFEIIKRMQETISDQQVEGEVTRRLAAQSGRATP